MSVKFATLTTHDGKSQIKINPHRVNWLVSIEGGYTKTHFGLDQPRRRTRLAETVMTPKRWHCGSP